MAVPDVSAALKVVEAVEAPNDYSIMGMSASNNLYFLKTRDVPHGHVEVYFCSAGSGYKEVSALETGLGAADAQDGTLQIHGEGLYFIRTRNTSDGRVQMARFSRNSGYRSADAIAPINLDCNTAQKGKWVVWDDDLYFIMTRDTRVGRVELHRWTHSSRWQHKDLAANTVFTVDEANKGQFDIWNGGLSFIQTLGGAQGRTILRGTIWRGDRPDYDWEDEALSTWYRDDGGNGDFVQNESRDLYFIKMRNVGGSSIEVHYSEKSRGLMEEPYHYPTALGTSGPLLGTICLDKVYRNPAYPGP